MQKISESTMFGVRGWRSLGVGKIKGTGKWEVETEEKIEWQLE